MTTETASEVAIAYPLMDDVATFADAFKAFEDAGINVTVVNEYDVVDKEDLVNVPFLITDFRFYVGQYGDAVACRAITQDNRKIIFNDGSTGVFAQVKALADKGIQGAILCSHGLSRSDYEYEDEKTGKMTPASTFYLS